MSGLVSRINSLKVDNPLLELFLSDLASAVDRINNNIRLSNSERVVQDPALGAQDQQLTVADLTPDVLVVRSLRFLEDQNSLKKSSSCIMNCRISLNVNRVTAPAAQIFDWNVIEFDTDDMTMERTALFPFKQIHINHQGCYLIGATIIWEPSAAGTFRQTYINKNSAVAGVGILALDQCAPPAGAGVGAVNMPITVHNFVKDDVLRVWVNQDTGGILNVQSAADFAPVFWAHRLS